MSGMVNSYAFGGGTGAHRYWRVWVTANNGDATYTAIGELEFRATPGGADQTVFNATKALSGGSGSANAGAEDHKAFNEATLTGWTRTATGTCYVGYDFQLIGSGAVSVQQVAIQAYTGGSFVPGRFPQSGSIDWSDNNVNWTTAGTFSGQTGWTSGQLRTFAVS